MGGLQFRKNDSRLTTIEEDLHLRWNDNVFMKCILAE